MFRLLRVLAVVVMGSVVGCGPGTQDVSGPADQAKLSRSALALEFADTYDVAGPPASGLVSVALAPSGTYVATLADGTDEQGTWTSPVGAQLPVTLYLKSATSLWTAEVLALDGALTIDRNGESLVAKSEHTVGPNESLCDGTGGAWTDDDVDAKTGLNCVCQDGQAYVPSHGGCIVVN